MARKQVRRIAVRLICGKTPDSTGLKLSLVDSASIVLLVGATVLTVVVVNRELTERATPQGIVRVVPSAEVSLVGQRIGSPEAPLTIVVFGDFQCQYCAAAQGLIKAVLAEYPESVAFRFRHLPLETIHPYAWTAALAAECAGDQGRFPEYHDLLYALQDSIGRIAWTDLAARAGVPSVLAFARCLADETHTDAVERDVRTARSLGVNGTPAFILGDELIPGLPPVAWFERRVERAFRKVK